MPTGINIRSSGIAPPKEVRPIPSWPGYGATKDGRIWSYRNQVYRKSRRTKRGYLRVNLSLNNKIKDCYVHQLVADAWLPNPENLPMLNHKNGVKTNNAVRNLERCTAQHNIQHGYTNGLHHRGEKSPAAKLTLKQVKMIRSSSQCRPLARRFGVSVSTICAIKRRDSWKHVS